ncbi:MAG: cytidylate kinase-like family protein [Deltaproteobacteria bacterium]|nr:cytidylate kinase-like family protein [Deltaproteobacteria bacterium]
MAVITISRQLGAGAITIGKLVAKKLGYKMVDEEIMQMIAKEVQVSVDSVQDIAIKVGTEGYLDRFRLRNQIGAFRKEYRKGFVRETLEEKSGYIDGKVYLELLHKVLPILAERDNAVIIGRGGQYILANHPNTLHVFLMADLEIRIKNMMAEYQLDYKQAQLFVEKLSQRRLHLYRYFNDIDYDRPELYDVVFNMNRLKMEEVAELLSEMASRFSSLSKNTKPSET